MFCIQRQFVDLITKYYATVPTGIFHRGSSGAPWGNQDHFVDWVLPLLRGMFGDCTLPDARWRAEQVLEYLVSLVYALTTSQLHIDSTK